VGTHRDSIIYVRGVPQPSAVAPVPVEPLRLPGSAAEEEDGEAVRLRLFHDQNRRCD
jgi:hypothetical protein